MTKDTDSDKPPITLGFASIELLEGGLVKCTVVWDDKLAEPEYKEDKEFFYLLMDRFSSGGMSHQFANFALDIGEARGQQLIGETVASIFESNCPNRYAMRPSDVFSTNNPNRAPVIHNG
jgi:hypothetical protein